MARNSSVGAQSFFGRLFEQLRNRSREREEKAFMDSLPSAYSEFMKRYVPENEGDEALFNKMKLFLMKTRQHPDVFAEEFAQIADGPLLQHLWDKSHDNEPDLRQAIVENPNCYKNILLAAVADPFSDVAAPAIRNPMLTERDLLKAVYRVDRTSPGTVEALEKRLGGLGYRVDWAPWENQPNSRDHDKPLILKVLDKDTEVPLDKDFNWKKPSSLDNIISNVKNRQEAQTIALSKAPVKDFNPHDNIER